MKTLLLSLTLLLFSNVASADWWASAKEKASSAMASVTETAGDAYDGTANFINENKDGWLDSGKELYESTKGMITGDESKAEGEADGETKQEI